MSFSDFITRYTAVSSTNLRTEIAEYYALDPDNGLTMNLGVNQLLQFGLDETRREFFSSIFNTEKFNAGEHFHAILRYLEKNEKLYKILLSCKEPLRFTEVLRKKETELLGKVYKNQLFPVDIAFFTHGMLDVIIDRFTRKSDISFDALEKNVVRWLNVLKNLKIMWNPVTYGTYFYRLCKKRNSH